MQFKRVDDDTLLELSGQGLNGAEIARQVGISKMAVSKRLRKLKAEEPPESYQRLTPKKQKFIQGLLENKTPTEAALAAYDCRDRASAKTIGIKLMKEEDVAVSYADLLAQEGVGKRRRVQRMAELIESKDTAAVCRMIELAAKLDGSLTEKIEHSVSIESIRALMALIPDQQPAIDITPTA